MRTIFIVLFFMILNIASVFCNDIYSLRQLYYEAANNKDSAKKFLTVMENIDPKTNPLLLCFQGMANLIKANHSYNPYTKLASFNRGKEMLEKAVASDANNVEIRFMRFCVQTNAPFFLGYNSNIDSDKEVILKGWGTLIDIDLKNKIKIYMIESNSCNTNEKIIFK